MAQGQPQGNGPEGSVLSFTLAGDANGILPDRMIAAMADSGLILPAYPFVESQIQPASLDLRLGDIAYRDQLRLHRAVDRKPGYAAKDRRGRKSEKLDGAA